MHHSEILFRSMAIPGVASALSRNKQVLVHSCFWNWTRSLRGSLGLRAQVICARHMPRLRAASSDPTCAHPERLARGRAAGERLLRAEAPQARVRRPALHTPTGPAPNPPTKKRNDGCVEFAFGGRRPGTEFPYLIPHSHSVFIPCEHVQEPMQRRYMSKPICFFGYMAVPS